MKVFEDYQHLEGETMSDRDKIEAGSKFWNKGKWDNFILPFLKEDPADKTFVDMGCNAGLFLKYAEDMGFSQVVGVDSNEEAVQRGIKWRDEHGSHYKFLLERMENCIDQLPVADYTVLANAHYYFYIADWIAYLDKLQNKSHYVIFVTTEKRNSQPSLASADPDAIRNYMKDWDEVGLIDALPTENDPLPRTLYGMMFKSRHLERVPMDSLDCANHVQDKFYREIEEGKDYHRTKYYRILKGYRKTWSEEQLEKFATDKIDLFNSVKEHGLLTPLIVNRENRVLDGNHKYSMWKHLGHQSIIVRRI